MDRNFYNKHNKMHQCLNLFYFGIQLYIFIVAPCILLFISATHQQMHIYSLQ